MKSWIQKLDQKLGPRGFDVREQDDRGRDDRGRDNRGRGGQGRGNSDRDNRREDDRARDERWEDGRARDERWEHDRARDGRRDDGRGRGGQSFGVEARDGRGGRESQGLDSQRFDVQARELNRRDTQERDFQERDAQRSDPYVRDIQRTDTQQSDHRGRETEQFDTPERQMQRLSTQRPYTAGLDTVPSNMDMTNTQAPDSHGLFTQMWNADADGAEAREGDTNETERIAKQIYKQEIFTRIDQKYRRQEDSKLEDELHGVATFVIEQAYDILRPNIDRARELQDAVKAKNLETESHKAQMSKIQTLEASLEAKDAAIKYYQGEAAGHERALQKQREDHDSDRVKSEAGIKRHYDNEIYYKKGEINKLKSDLDKERDRSKREYDTELSRRDRIVKQKDEEIGRMESRHTQAIIVANSNLEQRVAQTEATYTKQIEDLHSGYAVAIGEDRRQRDAAVAKLREDVQTVTAEARNERDRTAADHSRALESLRQDHSRALTEHSQKHESLVNSLQNANLEAHDKMTQMSSEHTAALATLKQTYTTQISDLVKAHEVEGSQLAQTHETEMSRLTQAHTAAIAQLTQAHKTEVTQLIRTHKAREEQLVSKHKDRTKGLRDEVADLNAALLTRDDEIYQGMIFTTEALPRKPDEAIKNQFLEIQLLVENLGGLGWKKGQKVWTEQVFRGIGDQHGQRPLRTAILQDAIWILLFHHVFCSPFRMFGDEGATLEQEWNQQCGKGTSSSDQVYNWPALGAKAERWRYLTIMGCREALRQPVPSQFDPRARLKKGFRNSQEGLVSELKAVLSSIVDLGPENMTTIERLAKKALTMWIDFEMHRCRIVVRLKGSATRSMTERVAQLQNGSLVLTMTPLVGRHGNVKGAELDNFTTIEGCPGSSLTIP